MNSYIEIISNKYQIEKEYLRGAVDTTVLVDSRDSSPVNDPGVRDISPDGAAVESQKLLLTWMVNEPELFKKLENVIHAAVNYIYTSKRYIFISVDKAKIQLCCEDIMYFEGDKRKVNVYLPEETYSFYSKMSDIEKMVDNSWFVRIHVSFIVNMDYVKAIYTDEIVLNNGIHLPVSRKYQRSVKLEHMRYLKWRMGL